MGSRLGQIFREMGNKQPKPPQNDGINQNLNSVKTEITNTIQVENDTIVALLIVILVIICLAVLFVLYQKHIKSIKKRMAKKRSNLDIA